MTMRSRPRLSIVEKYIVLSCVALAIYCATVFIVQIGSNFWPGPLFDTWVDIPLIEKAFQHSLTFADLVTAHNDAHRILIPRLLFILDYRFFAGTNVLLIAVSVLCKLAILFLFCYLLRDQRFVACAVLGALTCAAVFNVGTVYNVLFNFDIQWDLVSVFACYSLYGTLQIYRSPHPLRWRCLSYAFLTLAFFSHAGALSLPLVFILISLLYKRPRETVINLLLLIAVFYCHQHLPFADNDHPDTQNALGMLLLHPLVVATFVFKALSASLAFYLGTPGLFFSGTLIVLLLLSLMTVTRFAQTSVRQDFLAMALFLFFMLIMIAAARSIFTPGVWAASRFLTTILLFIACLHIHVWLLIDAYSKTSRAVILKGLLATHGWVMLGLVQIVNYNVAYKLSNVVFFSQSYLMAHGRTQDNAPRLLLWLHQDDVIADSDTFFRQNGLAWYANKKIIVGQKTDFIDTGKTLVMADNPSFTGSCPWLPPLAYLATAEGGIEFSAPMPSHPGSALLPILNRKTYYALDAHGVVVGSGYPFINEEGLSKHATLRGYSVSETIAYFAEADAQHRPRCLYRVSPVTH